MERNRQPVIFTSRELRIYDNEGKARTFGFFVSKAYLKQVIINYEEDGDKLRKYVVDFTINPGIFADDNHKGIDNIDIHAENGETKTRTDIFRDYKSCKANVKAYNNQLISYLTRFKSPYAREKIEQKFKEVMEYAKYLEEKYIPEEERELIEQQSLSEKIF